uniref:chemotaxis protein CheA n=1 Tax=Methylibium sp. TaxID=2067992 RepID=UPI001834D588
AQPHKVLKVSQEKIDRLMELIGEMVVAKNSLPYLAQRAEVHFQQRELAREIKAQYAVINRIAEDMQHAVMQVRMLPVGAVFQRFGRLVRDLSRKLGKEVNLVIEGEDTEADKNVIEPLSDPLIHILRNSLDHGIEMPEVRRAAGKPAAGTIRIQARQESDRVVIEISDDGAGVDPARVRAKAVERGLVAADRAALLSDDEAVQLVFLPGFSTADTISDLSGRGVGMDVVRTAIERINGGVELSSIFGKGTTLRLSLPLSMAVTNVMVIESAGRRLGVPMDLIVETVRVHADDIHHFKQARTTVLRGRIVPLRALNELLALDAEPLANEQGELAVLVVRIGNQNVGLLVDRFQGASDIILKPLEGVLAGLTGFAGTALMGDGGVLMVLNPKELL